MAKFFKLRFSKVLSSTLQSCRSNDPSDLPEEPVPQLFRLSPNSKLVTVDFPVNQLPSRMKGQHLRRSSSSSDRGGVSSAFFRSYGRSSEFKWQKEDKWHVIAKIYGETHTPRRKNPSYRKKNVEVLALPPLPPAQPSSTGRKKRQGKKKRVPANTNSAEIGRFSEDAGDERSGEKGTEALVENSTMECKSNSEAVHGRSLTRRHKRSKKKLKNRSKATHSIEIIHRQSSVSSTTEVGSPARLSMFKKLIPCSVDGKVKESFAVVKKSEDPYEDFKRSMMEMILEKQMFEEEDLEQMLQCFLSLNSRHYHILIFSAFSEIKEAMFAASARNSVQHRPVSSRS